MWLLDNKACCFGVLCAMFVCFRLALCGFVVCPDSFKLAFCLLTVLRAASYACLVNRIHDIDNKPNCVRETAVHNSRF